MTKEEFMLIATQEADSNLTTNEGGPFGAVIVKDGKIVGRGHNRVLIKHDPTCHAEVEAIRDACQNLGTHDLTSCELYTSCYPCPMCLSATIWANIKKFIMETQLKMLIKLVLEMISSTTILKENAKIFPF